MHRLRWILLGLLIIVSVAAGWGLKELVDERDKPVYDLECETYANAIEVKAGLLERGFRHSAYLGLVHRAAGEREDGTQFAYFRIDPTFISEFVVCFYEWPRE